MSDLVLLVVFISVFFGLNALIFLLINLAFNTYTTVLLIIGGYYYSLHTIVSALVFPASTWLFKRKIEVQMMSDLGAHFA